MDRPVFSAGLGVQPEVEPGVRLAPFSSVHVGIARQLSCPMTWGIASGGFAICQDDSGSGVISGFSGGIDLGRSRIQPLNDPGVTPLLNRSPLVLLRQTMFASGTTSQPWKRRTAWES
jgi:hypothetical protein